MLVVVDEGMGAIAKVGVTENGNVKESAKLLVKILVHVQV
jgi:hypothetical protein